MTESAKERVKQLANSFSKAKQELLNSMKPALLEAFKEVFDKFPLLESFGWPQYTPYFNDGDSCYFNVHCDLETIYINDNSCDNWETRVVGKSQYGYDETELLDSEKWKLEAAEEISDLIYLISNEVLEDWFNEGLVTVNRDGSTEVDDYSHD